MLRIQWNLMEPEWNADGLRNALEGLPWWRSG